MAPSYAITYDPSRLATWPAQIQIWAAALVLELQQKWQAKEQATESFVRGMRVPEELIQATLRHVLEIALDS
jgi:hypothetical protein